MAKFGSLATPIPTVTTNIGTRSGSVQAIVSGGPAGYTDFWQPNIIDDPVAGSSRFDVSVSGNLGAEIIYDFGQPVSVGALRYGGSSQAPFGAWQLFGSQTGTEWSQIGYESAFFGSPGYTIPANGQYAPLPYRILDWMAAGGGYTLDLDQPPYWWSNTLFFRRFKLVGVSPTMPSFPFDGGTWANQTTPFFKVHLFDLVAAERRAGEPAYIPMGQAEVWTGPLNSAYLGPDDGSNGTPQGGGGSGGGGDTTPPDGTPPPPPPPPPYSDYFHPYSRGVRGKLYNASTGPGDVGNGVTAQFSATNPPTVFAGPESGVNYNFGSGAGDGPYLGGDIFPGFRYEFTFPAPVILTGILGVLNEVSNFNAGTWKLVAFDAGAWRDISDPTVLQYPGAPRNCVWGNGVEVLIRGGADVVKSTRFGLQFVGGSGSGRIVNEWIFKIANSPLQGGDRRAVSTDTDRVLVTTNFSLTHSDGGTFTPDKLQRLVDSVLSTGNGGGNGDQTLSRPDAEVVGPKSPPYGQGRSASYIRFTADDPADSYFQFAFARGVVIRAIQPYIWGPREELDGGGNPTKWGLWKMAWSDSEAGPYTDVGVPFAWGDRAVAPFCSIQNDEGNPHGFWRLIKVSGTQLTSGNAGIEQFQFILEDVGEPTRYPTIYQDEDGFNAIPTITEDSRPPFSGYYRDEDGFRATPTIKINHLLTAEFQDEDGFDVYSELGPSMVVQMSVVGTGRA